MPPNLHQRKEESDQLCLHERNEGLPDVAEEFADLETHTPAAVGAELAEERSNDLLEIFEGEEGNHCGDCGGGPDADGVLRVLCESLEDGNDFVFDLCTLQLWNKILNGIGNKW